jgi:hypothetical protein
MSKRHSFTDAVYRYFLARPNVDVSAVSLEFVAGRQAWRTRVSECRIRMQAEGIGTIENRQRRVKQHTQSCALVANPKRRCNCQGPAFIASSYRYVPADPLQIQVGEKEQRQQEVRP